MQEKFIDIEKIIRSKNSKLLKYLPKFIINYLKKIIHQEEVNRVLYENRNLYGNEFCKELIQRFNIKIETKGLENIPKEGGYIFASNHPLGGMDAMALVTVISPLREDIKFIVNDILLHLKNLKGLFVGVDKHAVNSKNSLAQVNELFASDNAIFVFPAGLVSRKKKGVITDLEWKKTFITRARKHNKNVIPVYVNGSLSNFFYNLSNLRAFFGVKANIEMLYLADETFKQKNKILKITFGKPIAPSVFDKSKTDKEWAKWMKTKVYQLQDN